MEAGTYPEPPFSRSLSGSCRACGASGTRVTFSDCYDIRRTMSVRPASRRMDYSNWERHPPTKKLLHRRRFRAGYCNCFPVSLNFIHLRKNIIFCNKGSRQSLMRRVRFRSFFSTGTLTQAMSWSRKMDEWSSWIGKRASLRVCHCGIFFSFCEPSGRGSDGSGERKTRSRATPRTSALPSPLSEMQARATKRYCAAVGLEPSLVEPFFYTCWMYRALREAAWTSGPLEQGTYFNLLRLCIRQRGGEGLQWIFT